MLTMSWFECNEVTSYHRYFISVLTHRWFLSSPIPKPSSQIPLSHSSPLCFIRPQSFMLNLLTLNFLKSFQALVPPFSFHPTGSIRLDFSPFLVQAPWFTGNGCQFSRSVVSDSLRPHELQHTRLPCASPTLELNQTHAHRVSDAIQPSYPLSPASPPAFNLSQHQGLFK